jgi:DNA-binding SARP family transcriptional activator/TolB-like protein
MTLVRFSLFGGFDCRVGTSDAITFPTRKVRALAAYLAFNTRKLQTRDLLARLLWDDRTDAQARANLRKGLSRLRRALPERARDCLLLEADRVGLRPERVEIDVLLFERLVAEGTPASLERSIEVHRGEFLEDLAHCSEAFEEWMMAERRRLAEMLRHVLQRLFDHHVVAGGIDQAIQLALRLIALDPLQESVHRTLIRLYLYQDRTGAALDQYQRCRDLLARDLGAEPSPETEGLKAAILRKTEGAGDTQMLRGDSQNQSDPMALFRAEIGTPARLPTDATGRPSIAVLSFADANDNSHRHLGDALADDIATELGRFSELDVIAPASGSAGRHAAAPERAGSESRTTYVLDGRMRQLGDVLRITARLSETQTARQVWAERYDRPADQIVQVEDEISATIVATLLGEITMAAVERARRRPTTNWRAYDYYSMGLSRVYTQDADSLCEATRFFERAVEADPQFARAYSWLAVCRSRSAMFTVKGDAEAYARMRALVLDTVRKALSLDESDAAALAVLGWCHIWNWHFDDVAPIFERACRLRPCDGDMAMTYVTALVHLGEPEKAIAVAEAAIGRERRHPSFYLQDLATANFFARRNSRTLALLDELSDDRLGENRAVAAAACAHAGRLDDAREHARRYVEELREAWKGDASADLADYLAWEFRYRHVYRRPGDVAYLREGLRTAGLG